ncbi:MAG TPA: chemotaxis protein CheB [Anaerolineae bacterium]|nr:chemotaxis protein CheB [Anaerolineae bacterium]
MIRILIVDDSTVFRAALKAALERDATIQVVGQAGNGREAIELVARLEPDLVTMDVVMPGLDGFQTVKQIMALRPTAILVISDLKREMITFRMLAAGALDVINKPGAGPEALRAIVERVKNLAGAQLLPPKPEQPHSPTLIKPPGRSPGFKANFDTGPVVILVSSAGGPLALAHILGELPPELHASVIIVQHITAGFAQGLAKWLAGICRLPVQLAEANQVLQPGSVLVAPDHAQLIIAPGRRILLDASQAAPTLRPAADITLRSAAPVCGADLLSVVLTGMGNDGAAGAQAVKANSGCVAVQDQTTSAIYGMPRAARPFADVELPLDEIAAFIVRFVHDHSH